VGRCEVALGGRECLTDIGHRGSASRCPLWCRSPAQPTATHEVLDLPQPRSLCHGTTDPVDNDLFATDLLQGILLEVEVLLMGGNSCVSDIHSGPDTKGNNSLGTKCILTLFSYCVYYPNLGSHATENGKRDDRKRNLGFFDRLRWQELVLRRFSPQQ
jgi:hypothetical protein